MVTPVKLFPTLYRIDDCFVSSHPDYHPSTQQYLKYWSGQERICIEGKWILDREMDQGGWRYMPGNLYWYVNFCQIADEDEKGNTTAYISPLLRDTDWMFAYVWLAARGFSGFSDDDDYTCDILATMDLDNLPKKYRSRYERNAEHLYSSSGKLKKYMDPVEYLYRVHTDPKGLPLYLNEAQNLIWFGSRGGGKSYRAANLVIGHEYNFFGKKYYNDSYLKDPAGVEIYVGSAIAAKSSDLLKKFMHTQEYLKRNFGAWGNGDDFIPGYFSLNSTGSIQPNNTRSPYRHEYKFNQNGTWITAGTGTKIHHGVYTAENPQAAVGTRPTVMVTEEAGLLPNLIDTMMANETCMIRRNKFGSALIIGTGGNIEKIHDARIMFEDPETYKCLGFEDVYEKRIKPIGYFEPAYYVDNDFKDELGNTDIEAAFEHEMRERKKRESGNNSYALDGYRMARPIVPSEMFLSRESSIFPVTFLRKRYADVITNNLFELRASIGELKDVDGDIRWIEDVQRKNNPITDLNTDKYTDITGSVVIYEHPGKNTPMASFKRSLYKVCYDPVKDDGGGTSLACILVYKGYPEDGWNQGMTNTIVAEYFGRYDDVTKIHDIAILLAEYYHAKIMVETNVPDFVRYCKRLRKVHLLQPSPYEAISRAVKNPGRKYGVGIDMSSKSLKIHAEQLTRSYLLDPWKEDKLTLDMLYSPRLLLELIHYERGRNFDGISAMYLLMLWISQEREYRISPKQEVSEVERKKQKILLRKRYIDYQLTRSRPFHVY